VKTDGGAGLVFAKMPVLALLAAAAVLGSCPTGFIESPETGRCYFVPDTYASHRGCVDVCQGIGGGLACIDSKNESEFVSANVVRMGINGHSSWIGHYREPYPDWSATCDSVSDFDYFWPGSHRQGRECATISNYYGWWVGVACEYRQRCVCQHGVSATSAYLARAALLESLYGYKSGLTIIVTVVVALFPALVVLTVLALQHAGKRGERMLQTLVEFKVSTDRNTKRSSSGLQSRYSAAKLASFSMRVYVSGTLFCVGWGLLFTGVVPYLLSEEGIIAGLGPADSLLCVSTVGGVVAFISLTPKDAKIINTLTVLSCLGHLGLAINFLTTAFGGHHNGLWYYWLVLAVGSIVAFLALVPASGLRRCKRPYFDWFYSPRWTLLHFWVCWRTWLVFMGLGELIYLIVALSTDAGFSSHPMCTSKALYCASLFVSFCLSAAPVRRRIHATLSTRASSRSTAGEEVQKASVLASMIGHRSAGVAYKLGLKNFVGLPMSALTLGDFKTNQDTGLYQKTLHCDMGGVDAFISHSWRDEAELKWEKLEAWKAELGKPDPLVWLDKACINQQKIDESLASLPVFLAGCENLVVLAGKTYTQRLWYPPLRAQTDRPHTRPPCVSHTQLLLTRITSLCAHRCVMELFTFVEMGGTDNHIQFFVLGAGDRSRLSSVTTATSGFQRFNARDADCFKPEEKSHLLGIIETTFGDVSRFDKTVRGLFAAKTALRKAAARASAAVASRASRLSGVVGMGSSAGAKPTELVKPQQELEA
jgi:hypothetical protein